MIRKKILMILVALILTIALAPTNAVAKKPAVELSNNLSYPAIAVDGYVITPLTSPLLTVPYAGDYPGLTAEEIVLLQENGPWYAQKTDGNVWQADFENRGSVSVTSINWSDNIESLNPKVRSSFRLELTLFLTLDTPMTAYDMAVLEFPNSTSELQGTNNLTQEIYSATVVSDKPRFVVQYLGSSVPALDWNADGYWFFMNENEAVIPQLVPITFGPELNVGGKYIYGAASGGWKPALSGYYRLTFYMPAGCTISLAEATIGDIPASQIAAAVIDPINNLTYIDVKAVAKR